MAVYIRRNTGVGERLDLDNAMAQIAQQQADLDFIAMVAGVDLDQGEEEVSEDE